MNNVPSSDLVMSKKIRASFVARTKLSSVIRPGMTTPCLEWTGGHVPKGHGQLRIGKKMVYAHRVAWVQRHGDIPDGLCVCHKCDNPPCVNVDHLFLGTNDDNVRDCQKKKRFASGERHGLKLHPGTAASGDMNGSRRHPERLARGDRHPSKTHPESVARGENASRSKLTYEKVRSIFKLRSEGLTLARIASQFGVGFGQIGQILQRKAWGHVDLGDCHQPQDPSNGHCATSGCGNAPDALSDDPADARIDDYQRALQAETEHAAYHQTRADLAEQKLRRVRNRIGALLSINLAGPGMLKIVRDDLLGSIAIIDDKENAQ